MEAITYQSCGVVGALLIKDPHGIELSGQKDETVISATPRRNETANIDEPLEYIRYLKFPRLTLDKRVISAATLPYFYAWLLVPCPIEKVYHKRISGYLIS